MMLLVNFRDSGHSVFLLHAFTTLPRLVRIHAWNGLRIRFTMVERRSEANDESDGSRLSAENKRRVLKRLRWAKRNAVPKLKSVGTTRQ